MTIRITYTERDLKNIRVIMGHNLRAARENAQMSMTDVMKAIYGVSNNRNRICEIETARKKELTLSEMLRFQALYGQSLDFMCGLSVEPELDMLAGSVNHAVNQAHSLVETITEQVSEIVVSQLKTVAKDDHATLIQQAKALCDAVKKDHQKGLASHESLVAVGRTMHVIRQIEVKQARNAQAVETQMIQIKERLLATNGHKLIRDRNKQYQYSLPITIIPQVVNGETGIQHDCVDTEFYGAINGK